MKHRTLQKWYQQRQPVPLFLCLAGMPWYHSLYQPFLMWALLNVLAFLLFHSQVERLWDIIILDPFFEKINKSF
jgi:hypothetical protein